MEEFCGGEWVQDYRKPGGGGGGLTADALSSSLPPPSSAQPPGSGVCVGALYRGPHRVCAPSLFLPRPCTQVLLSACLVGPCLHTC